MESPYTATIGSETEQVSADPTNTVEYGGATFVKLTASTYDVELQNGNKLVIDSEKVINEVEDDVPVSIQGGYIVIDSQEPSSVEWIVNKNLYTITKNDGAGRARLWSSYGIPLISGYRTQILNQKYEGTNYYIIKAYETTDTQYSTPIDITITSENITGTPLYEITNDDDLEEGTIKILKSDNTIVQAVYQNNNVTTQEVLQ